MPANPSPDGWDDIEDNNGFDDFDDFIEDDTANEPTPAQAVEEKGATSKRAGFAAWRRSRPFWPGLLVIISGIIILAPAYLTIRISDLLVMISTISGVSTLLIGALLIMFGLGMWLQPAAVVYLGVLSILVALVALPASNIGGFVVGTLTGIIGGSLALAWEKEDRKPRKKRTRRNKSAALQGASAKAVIAVLGCVSVAGLSLADSRTAYAQELPSIPMPQPFGLPNPSDIVGGLESLIPPPPQLPPPPTLPELPRDGEPPHIPIPDSVTVPGLGEVVSPATEEVPPPGRPTPSGSVSVVTADSVVLTGNVHVTLEDVPVAGTTQRALILSGDRLEAKNLGLQIPGPQANGFLSTGPVTTTVSNGPVRVIATGLSATPAVSNVSTVPVAVNLNGTVGSVLDQLGIPNPNGVPQINVPDVVMDEISLRNVTLDMVSLYGMNFNAPSVQLTASM